MKSIKIILLAILVIALNIAFAGITEANLLTNPGFESGDETGWIASSAYVKSTNPHSGTYQMQIEEYGETQQMAGG